MCAMRGTDHGLPIIDLSTLRAPHAARRNQAATALLESCERFGAFYLCNHGLPEPVADGAYGLAREIFALPPDVKLGMGARKTEARLGYYGLYEELTDRESDFDCKELFDVMRDPEPNMKTGAPGSFPSQWPAAIPNAKKRALAYLDSIEETGRNVMRLLALALGLRIDWFDEDFRRPITMLRLAKYPPSRKDAPPNGIGCGAHRDYGCLTLISQYGAGGLQFKTADGVWVDCPPLPGTLVCNVGHMLRRWSNDRFHPSLHRVLNPRKATRHSVIVFFDPWSETEISCLKDCSAPGRPAKYPSVTAGQHLREVLSEAVRAQEDKHARRGH